MKKFISALILVFCLSQISALAQEIVCPIYNDESQVKETFFNNVSGISFFSKKIIEMIIENELKEELGSDFKAELKIFNLKKLKFGEFKALELKSNNIQYRALSLSDFSAKTICDYNKIIYINKKVKYPMPIPFKYSAKITNDDIKNIITSEEFQKELKRNESKPLYVKTPNVEIKSDKIYFIIPIKTFIGSFKIKLSCNIKVEDNKLVLTNTTFSSKSNIISESMINSLLEEINPMQYITSALNGKYYKVDIQKAQIVSDEIKIDGTFVINKNYGGDNE